MRILVLASGLAAVLSIAAENASADEARGAAARALPYLAEHGVDWIESRQCVSCHQVSFLIWSHNAAQQAGLEVDDRIEQWRLWAVQVEHFQKPANRDKPPATTMDANIDTMAQLLLAETARGGGSLKSGWAQSFLRHLAGAQQADGSWKAGGQLPMQKRPKRETHEATTMWTLLALSRGSEELDESYDADRGWQFVSAGAAGESTEWWAVRLLLAEATQRGDAADEARRKLLATQRADGGWGWRLEDDSDALGTGLALYALSRSEGGVEEGILEAARAFLIRTQKPDGSWAVPGTKQAKRDRIEETASYWGTAWATMALLEADRTSG